MIIFAIMGDSCCGRPDEVVALAMSSNEGGFRNRSGRRVSPDEVGPFAAPRRRRWDARPFAERFAEKAARILAWERRRTESVMAGGDAG